MGTSKLELDNIKDGVRKYWDYDSKAYDSSPGTGGEEENRIWKELLSGAIGAGPKKILDVGTGTGIIAMFLAELGYDVTGVDFSNGMMDIARKKALEKGANIRFMEGDVENLCFEDGAFDCVTARYVLWTLPNPDKAVREWARAVKPGGKIVIIDGKWAVKGLLPRLSEINYHIYRLIRFGKNPFIKNQFTYDYRKDVRSGLPNPHGVEKEQIVGYMTGAGVTNINVIDLKMIRDARRKHIPWYLKYSYDHPTYIVSGIAGKK